MTSSRCHLCHAGCTNSAAERIMQCTNAACSSRQPGAAPIDRDDNAVLNIAHRVLAAWLDPEGKSSSALRRPELLPRSSDSSAASAAASADMASLLDDDSQMDAEDPECADQLADAAPAATVPLQLTPAAAQPAAGSAAAAPGPSSVGRRRRL